MARKSAASAWLRQLGHGTRHLDAGRPAADDDEGQQPPALVRVVGRSRRARRPSAPARGCGSRRRSSSGPARPAPTRPCRSRNGGRRWRARDSRSGTRRSSRTTSRLPASTPDDLAHLHRDVGLPAAGSRGSARRCRPATGRRSRPGRAAAGTGGSCGDRSTMTSAGARASARAAARPPKPAPTMTTRGRVRSCACDMVRLRRGIGWPQHRGSRGTAEVRAADGCDRARLCRWRSGRACRRERVHGEDGVTGDGRASGSGSGFWVPAATPGRSCSACWATIRVPRSGR